MTYVWRSPKLIGIRLALNLRMLDEHTELKPLLVEER